MSIVWYMCLCVVLCVGLCTGHFVIVPLNLTYLHCLQHSFIEHFFNWYFIHKRVSLLNTNEFISEQSRSRPIYEFRIPKQYFFLLELLH